VEEKVEMVVVSRFLGTRECDFLAFGRVFRDLERGVKVEVES